MAATPTLKQAASQDAGTRRVQEVPVDMISAGPAQARRRFDPVALEELAASIAESGVVQPVVLRSRGDDAGGYELLAGERRWRASQLAGLHQIPAIIRDDLSEREAAVLGLIENLQRESLTPIETASGLSRLCQLYDLTHDEAAGRIGKSRAYVTNFLRLLKLEQSVQDMVDEGELSLGHAKILAGLPQARQRPLARHTVKQRWSVRALERAIKSQTRAAGEPQIGASAGETAELERDLSDHLGYPVNISYDSKTGRGEVVVSFSSLDEFEGILQRWNYRQR